jgi:hypothetical protein
MYILENLLIMSSTGTCMGCSLENVDWSRAASGRPVGSGGIWQVGILSMCF